MSSPQHPTFEHPHTCEFCKNIRIVLRLNLHCSFCKSGEQITTTKHFKEPKNSHSAPCSRCGSLCEVQIAVLSTELDITREQSETAASGGCHFWKKWNAELPKPVLPDGVVFVLGGSLSNGTLRLICSYRNKTHEETPAKRRTSHKAHPQFGLRCWTTFSDPAFKFIQSRPYETDVQSPTSWHFVRSSLQTCLSSHAFCRGEHADQLNPLHPEVLDMQNAPARLVDVGIESAVPYVRLVLTEEADAHTQYQICTSGYAALSYCWGGPNPLQLLSSNLRNFQKSILIAQMPRSIQDAVLVARTAGIRFLWIDALCIIQNSQEDKAKEIQRMGGYYSSSLVTICAASSSRCTDGFLGPRQSTPMISFGPVKATLRLENGVDIGTVYLIDEPTEEGTGELTWTGDQPLQPIARRGWTFQESTLSRRMLVYSTYGLYWVCSSAAAGNGGEKAQVGMRMPMGFRMPVSGIYSFVTLLDLPIRHIWEAVVKYYSRREIGFPGDKLLAVSGIAAQVLQLCRTRREDVTYAAGLMLQQDRYEKAGYMLQKDRYEQAEALTWQPLSPAGTHRSQVYRAPSWSWAAVDGACSSFSWGHPTHIARTIEPIRKRGEFQNDGMTTEFFVVDSVAVDLLFPEAPLGAVKSATLKMQAKHRSLFGLLQMGTDALEFCLDHDGKPVKSNSGDFSQSPSVQRVTTICLHGDTIEDCGMLSQFVEQRPHSTDDKVFLMPISDQRGTMGLILHKVGHETYSRVGVFSSDNKGLVMTLADWLSPEFKCIDLV